MSGCACHRYFVEGCPGCHARRGLSVEGEIPSLVAWRRLADTAARLDAEIDVASDGATIRDIASLKTLATITVGNGMVREDRDYVLRAAVTGALVGIRRMGA